jgi:hypothetical protein
MVVLNGVQPEDVVSALNVPPLDDDGQYLFLERYSAAGGNLPRKQTRAFVDALLSRWLRRYVDEWLQSGVRPNGSEAPTERKLSGSGFVDVQEYLEKYPPYMSLTDAGQLKVYVCEVVPYVKGHGRLLEATLEKAKRLFTGVMAGDWGHRLCQCRYHRCKRYFLLSRLGGIHKHGTFCSRRHQALASAVLCTKQRRKAAEHELIEFAGQWLRDFPVTRAAWMKDTRLKGRLAQAVSKYILHKRALRALRTYVRVNWVTQHQVAIEQQRKAPQG